MNSTLDKKMYRIMFQSLRDGNIEFENGNTWLKLGNHSPKQEAVNFLVQDRNFIDKTRRCFG